MSLTFDPETNRVEGTINIPASTEPIEETYTVDLPGVTEILGHYQGAIEVTTVSADEATEATVSASIHDGTTTFASGTHGLDSQGSAGGIFQTPLQAVPVRSAQSGTLTFEMHVTASPSTEVTITISIGV